MPCTLFNILGGVLEFGGILLTAVVFLQRQRRTLPERQGIWRRRVHATLVRLRLRRTPPPQTVYLEGIASGHASASGDLTIKVDRAAPPTLEDRVGVLEQVAQDLRRAHEEAEARLGKRIAEASERLNEVAADLRGQINAQQATRRDEFAQARPLEITGIGLFLLGVVFSTLGNVLPC
jgi:hypothetical protein